MKAHTPTPRNGEPFAQKETVAYAELLKLAHEEGLKSITTELLLQPSEENGRHCIVKATVETERGRYEGLGDADPGNVESFLLPHLIRVAETRAKARALRDAVNVGVVSPEGLDGVGPNPTPRPRPGGAPPPRPGGDPPADRPPRPRRTAGQTAHQHAAQTDEGWERRRTDDRRPAPVPFPHHGGAGVSARSRGESSQGDLRSLGSVRDHKVRRDQDDRRAAPDLRPRKRWREWTSLASSPLARSTPTSAARSSTASSTWTRSRAPGGSPPWPSGHRSTPPSSGSTRNDSPDEARRSLTSSRSSTRTGTRRTRSHSSFRNAIPKTLWPRRAARCSSSTSSPAVA